MFILYLTKKVSQQPCPSHIDKARKYSVKHEEVTNFDYEGIDFVQVAIKYRNFAAQIIT